METQERTTSDTEFAMFAFFCLRFPGPVDKLEATFDQKSSTCITLLYSALQLKDYKLRWSHFCHQYSWRCVFLMLCLMKLCMLPDTLNPTKLASKSEAPLPSACTTHLCLDSFAEETHRHRTRNGRDVTGPGTKADHLMQFFRVCVRDGSLMCIRQHKLLWNPKIEEVQIQFLCFFSPFLFLESKDPLKWHFSISLAHLSWFYVILLSWQHCKGPNVPRNQTHHQLLWIFDNLWHLTLCQTPTETITCSMVATMRHQCIQGSQKSKESTQENRNVFT